MAASHRLRTRGLVAVPDANEVQQCRGLTGTSAHKNFVKRRALHDNSVSIPPAQNFFASRNLNKRVIDPA
jgi:hypothetical protein